jgi:hypothetical protein
VVKLRSIGAIILIILLTTYFFEVGLSYQLYNQANVSKYGTNPDRSAEKQAYIQKKQQQKNKGFGLTIVNH